MYVASQDEMASPTTYPTTRFVQKNNELTISSVQLSYDFFRHGFVKKIGMERIVLRCTVNELHKYSSIRVERGTDYPFARKFNFELAITL